MRETESVVFKRKRKIGMKTLKKLKPWSSVTSAENRDPDGKSDGIIFEDTRLSDGSSQLYNFYRKAMHHGLKESWCYALLSW